MSRLDDFDNEIKSIESSIKSYEQQLKIINQRLQKIKEQIAKYGRLNAPPEKLMEEEDLTDEITQLETHIYELRKKLAELIEKYESLKTDEFAEPLSDTSAKPKLSRHSSSEYLRNRYKIKRVLDTDAIDSVYLADDTQNDYEVAIKQFNTGKLSYADNFEARREDFERQARFMREMEHPSIVGVRNVFKDNGTSYYVMRYLPTTLYEKLSQPGYENGMSYEQASKIFKQICEGLEYCYQKSGQIHGHINPGNILLDNSNQPKITNFGASYTKPNIDFVPYLAPEQLRRERVRPETDVYALGVLFYKLLTGRSYDLTENLVQNLRKKDIPKGIAPIIRKALSKNPTDRFTNAGAIQRAVDKLQINGGEIISRLSPLAIMSGFIILLLIGGIFWFSRLDLLNLTSTASITKPPEPIDTSTSTTKVINATPSITSLPTIETPTLITPSTSTPTTLPTQLIVTPTITENILLAARVLVDGKIQVGVRFDAPPFGRAKNWSADNCDPSKSKSSLEAEGKTFEPEGYDIRIARELAKRWLDDEDAVEFRCVPGPDRQEDVRTGDNVRLGIFSFSTSKARCANLDDEFNFDDPIRPEDRRVWCSDPYMLDGQGVLVRNDSTITHLCHSEIQTVSVLTKTSALSKFSEDLSSFCGLSTSPYITITDTRQAAIDLVTSNQAEAYATNFEIVWALANEDPDDEIKPVDGELGPAEAFGIAVTPGEKALLNLINEAIGGWKENGILLTLMKDAPPLKCAGDSTLIPQLQENLCGLKPITDTLLYTVRSGDTLSGIAGTLWGDSGLWPCITAANGKDQNNPVIEVGEVLTIPVKPAHPYEPEPDNVNCTP